MLYIVYIELILVKVSRNQRFIYCPEEKGWAPQKMQGPAKCIGVALHLFKMELRKLSVVYRFLPFCHHFFFDGPSSALESLQEKRSVASVALSLGTLP
jgi:hypothetical protein